VTLFQRAVRARWSQTVRVLPWLDVLRTPAVIDEVLRANVLLRIESPGDDFLVWRELVALGADAFREESFAAVSAETARTLEFEKGRVRFLRQWYLGWCAAVRGIEAALTRTPPRLIMNRPTALRRCFDKAAVREALERHGVPGPDRLSDVHDFADLRRRMQMEGVSQVFVKPRHSSTASGVIALRCVGPKLIARTSLEQVAVGRDWHFYNSFALKTYCDWETVARAVEFVLAEGAVVERWIPKLTLGANAVDVRVVVVGHRALHAVGRASRGPITNLHLRNQRIDSARIRERVGVAAWEAALTSAKDATRACDCAYAGVDVLFDAAGQRHAVLEVNAFGDLLPGLIHEGRDTYTAELSLWEDAA
jgi:hypothetical protein